MSKTYEVDILNFVRRFVCRLHMLQHCLLHRELIVLIQHPHNIRVDTVVLALYRSRSYLQVGLTSYPAYTLMIVVVVSQVQTGFATRNSYAVT